MKRSKVIGLLMLLAVFLPFVLSGTKIDSSGDWSDYWIQRIKPEYRYVQDWDGNLIPLTPQLLENNFKLIEAGKRFSLIQDSLINIFGGTYVDVPSCTFYIWLKEISKEYTEPLKKALGEVDGIEVKFIQAKFTLAELIGFQRKIEKSFFGVSEDELQSLYVKYGEPLRTEAINKLFTERKKEITPLFANVPITSVGPDIKNNGLLIGLKELKPEYVETLRLIIGNEVPIGLYLGGLKLLNDRTSRHRPLVGGIQVTTSFFGGGRSTLGFQATHTSGTRGFVVSGHVGGVNSTVWQPTGSVFIDNRVGSITKNPQRARYSDSAFVTTTTRVDPLIWPSFPIVGWEASIPAHVGTYAWKDGIATGVTNGMIRYIRQTVVHPNFEYLYNQVLAEFSADFADSGGPVYHPYSVQIVMLGVVVGSTHSGFRVYSPVEGIQADLQLNWGSSW